MVGFPPLRSFKDMSLHLYHIESRTIGSCIRILRGLGLREHFLAHPTLPTRWNWVIRYI
jgi:hypothetical protein